MSASYLVDLYNTCQMGLSLPLVGSGTLFAASGVIIGQSVDLLNANSFCNLAAFGLATASGDLRLQVQVSDFDTSGSFTDPTSGLAQLPTIFASGGIVAIASGSTSVLGQAISGQFMLSGWAIGAGFQRTQRYARINLVSGTYVGAFTGAFISQFKSPGSGGGFSFLPGSGTVNV